MMIIVGAIYFYYMLCEWKNPENNKRYIFKSDNFWNNPQKKIKSSIDIYINVKCPVFYYIDCMDMLIKDKDEARKKYKIRS